MSLFEVSYSIIFSFLLWIKSRERFSSRDLKKANHGFSICVIRQINSKIEEWKTDFQYQFSNKNWKLKIEKFLSIFNFQFWIETEIHKNVFFHKMKIEWHFRCMYYISLGRKGHSIFVLKWNRNLTFFRFSFSLSN